MTPVAGTRFPALDVFRGATVALMILVNNPGSWSHLYPPLAHASWHGLTLTDLVFPFFLFAVGNAMAFAIDPAQPNSVALWHKVARRMVWIFGLGLLLNAAPFMQWTPTGLAWRNWEQLRVMGVLQRIAIAYGLAVVVVRAWPAASAQWLAIGGLLLGYWALCHGLGTPGDPYGIEGFFGTRLDRAVFGTAHLYQGEGVAFDPEGIASTLPCVAQVLIGYRVGCTLRAGSVSARALLAGGLALLLAGWLASLAMPINKKLWTSSYVLVSSGWALLTLAAMIAWLRRGADRRLAFWQDFGSNALFIFVFSGLLPRFQSLLRWQEGVDASGAPRYIQPFAWWYQHGIAPWFAEQRLGSLVYAISMLGLYWVVARTLRQRGIFIRV